MPIEEVLNRLWRPPGAGGPERRRVLLVAEAVTLAQVVRLATLGAALDRNRYEVHFACAEFSELVFGTTDFVRWPLDSLARRDVDKALAAGRRLYNRATLARYVRSDLAVIDAVRPHLIVGDLRWSLAVSAPMRRVPLATLANAYWSPFAVRQSLPMPEHPIVRALGVRIAARGYPIAAPWVFRHFAAPLNQLRRAHGMPDVGSLPEAITHGDFTLYADTPFIAPTRELPPGHRYLGPVLWSPGGTLPSGWGQHPQRVPIYVTLGSSGDPACLTVVLEAVRTLPVDVLVSTAGRDRPSRLPDNVRVFDFVPGELAARRAHLVVTHGGSSTGYQALAEATPVVGIAYNLDHYLSMTGIARAGAGILLRSGTVTADELRKAIECGLSDRAMKQSAARVARDFAKHSATASFARFVDELFACDATGSRRESHAIHRFDIRT